MVCEWRPLYSAFNQVLPWHFGRLVYFWDKHVLMTSRRALGVSTGSTSKDGRWPSFTASIISIGERPVKQNLCCSQWWFIQMTMTLLDHCKTISNDWHDHEIFEDKRKTKAQKWQGVEIEVSNESCVQTVRPTVQPLHNHRTLFSPNMHLCHVNYGNFDPVLHVIKLSQITAPSKVCHKFLTPFLEIACDAVHADGESATVRYYINYKIINSNNCKILIFTWFIYYSIQSGIILTYRRNISR